MKTKNLLIAMVAVATLNFQLLTFNSIASTTIPAGNVSGTWTLAGSPYLIQGNIQILNATTLTIEPGVTVNFQGIYKLNVQGRLLAIGTTTDTIIFTAANTSNGWKGIRFDNTPSTNDTSKIVYCKLQYGKATGTSPNNYGGALYFNNFSKTMVSNCRISSCTAYNRGGAIYCSYSSPTISNNTISSNMAAGGPMGSGGGIYCYYSSPIISNNNISNNNCASHGGGISCTASNSVISNNIIFNNSAEMGGGIYCNGGSPTISNNTISNNTASCSGGGIYCSGSNPTISNNTISNNTASAGGGIICQSNSSPSIINNTIANNRANDGGGGVYCSVPSSSPSISNNSIVNNSAVRGGALFCENTCTPTLHNSILWGNVATNGAEVFLADASSNANFYHCDVQGGYAAFELNGYSYTGIYQNNIDTDPLFVSPSGGSGTGFNGVIADWSLQSNSPCINTGDPNGTYPSTDIAGNARVTVCLIDIGAYEYQNGIPLTATVSQNQQSLCYNDNTATATITAAGGSGSYTYSWNPGGQTTATATGLGSITYTVTATETSYGCSITKNISIAQPTQVTFTKTSSDILCKNDNSGSITFSATGGTGALFYSVDSGITYQSSNIFTGLSPKYYPLFVKDANNCIANEQGQTIQDAELLSFTTNHSNVLCKNDNAGSITVSGIGGTGTLNYSKDNGSTYQLSSIFTGLIAGTYPVVVKDANNCVTAAQSVIITEPVSLPSFTKTSIDVLCKNNNTGSINVSASGGTSTLQYSKDNGSTYQSSNIFPDLIASTYPVVVKDANNCVTAAQSVVISEPALVLSFTTTPINVLCKNDNSGSITINASGGTPSFQYSKDNGLTYQSSNIFTGLVANTYQILVKDTNNCVTAAQSVNISEPALVLSFTSTPSDVLCKNGNSGSITVNASGGTPSFQYSKDSGLTFQSSNVFTGLVANTYLIVVKDTNSCVAAAQSVNIGEPASLISFTTSDTNVSCYSGNNGSIIVTAIGGTGILYYSNDSGTTFQTQAVFSNLISGQYSVIVKDANNCVAVVQTDTLFQPNSLPTATFTTQDESSSLYCDGSIKAQLTGGTGIIQDQWLDFNQVVLSTTDSVGALCAGTYTLNLTDANGCTNTYSKVIQPGPIPSAPPICLVTVDSTFTHNLVVWEKTNLNMIGIDSFIVYREIGTNTYQAIGAVFHDSISTFDDFAANPATTGYRYKLKSKNTQGVLSLYSDYHNSIYLTNTGGNFSWTPYQVENVTTPVFTYNVYRDDYSTGNFQTIGNTTGNQFGYTDINFSSYPNASYYVEAVMTSGVCNPTRTSITASHSNVKYFGNAGVQQLNTHVNIYIYPNPANNTLIIRGISGETTIRMFDLPGKLVYENKPSLLGRVHGAEVSINTSLFTEGIYMLLTEGKAGKTFHKLVISH